MYVLTSVRRYRWCVFFWVAGCLSAQGAATAQIPAVAPDSATWRWAFQPTLGTLSLQNSRYPGQLTDGTSPAVGIQFRGYPSPNPKVSLDFGLRYWRGRLDDPRGEAPFTHLFVKANVTLATVRIGDAPKTFRLYGTVGLGLHSVWPYPLEEVNWNGSARQFPGLQFGFGAELWANDRFALVVEPFQYHRATQDLLFWEFTVGWNIMLD